MNEHTRRQFLWKTIPGVALGGVGLTAPQALAAEAQQPTTRAVSPVAYAIELDRAISPIYSAEGGQATASVVLEKLGTDYIQHKHLAGVRYEDIVVSCGTGMSKSFYEWIKTTFARQFVRKNGAIIAFDFNGKPVSRLEWTNGLITEVGFPACDASSKDIAKMIIKITPEVARLVLQPPGTPSLGPPDAAARRRWLPANFRLQIDGCLEACRAVNKIEAIAVKTAVVEHAPGELRNPIATPAHLEVPDLAVTTAESKAAEFYQWHQDFVIKANNGRDKEKSGTLEFLTPDLKAALFTLTFHGLGIFKLTPTQGNENISRVTAEMYCDDIGFAYGAQQ